LLLSGEKSILLPEGCQVLNISAFIPRVAAPGGLSSSLDE